MSGYAGAIVATIAFLIVVRAVGLFRKPTAVFGVAMRAMTDLRNPALDDDAKERLMRQHSLSLGGLFLQITGASLLALGAPFALLWLLDLAGLLSLDAALAAMLSWQFLVAATVVLGGAAYLSRTRRIGRP